MEDPICRITPMFGRLAAGPVTKSGVFEHLVDI